MANVESAETLPAAGASDLPKAKILIVDDDERTALAVQTVLEELGQELVIANSGEEALRRLLHEDFALILLDVQMPGMDGYETASLIRGRRRSRHIPIVFLTAVYRDDSHILQAYSAGAVDMVFKPVEAFILKSKVSIFVELYQKQQEIKREAELRHWLQEENFRVRSEKFDAEEALRRARERQETILRSLPVCVVSRGIEPPYPALFVSSNVEQLTGFPAHRFVDEPGFGLSRVHPEDVNRVIDAMRAAVTTGEYSCEFRWRCADDRYRVFFDQGVLAPAEDGKPQEIFGTLLDVTEQRLLQQQLVQAQKMEAVGQLTGGIAHDFNNLLTVVFGNIDLLAPHLAGNERAQRQLRAMRHAAERGRSLTGQLLAFSRRQHLHPEVFDVNLRVRSFEALLRQAIGENIDLALSLSADPVIAELDPAQLETALLNLAVNARDAMPSGGKLDIRIARVERAPELLAQYSEAPPGPWIVLTIEDTGMGIPKEVLGRVFEPFFTTKETGKGSGLGLCQVYGFVSQSGGYVTIASAPNQGTRLSLYLKPSEKQPVEQRVVEVTSEQHNGAETILVVEDDAAVLSLTSEMLGGMGYHVITASDGTQALRILESNEAINLIFTDVVMPGGKTGVQLAAEAHRLRPVVKVLLASGYTGEALSHHKPDHVDLPLIAKPFHQKELGSRIRSLLDGAPSAAE
jgi:signal transduction histidine kinase/FixJ family two-component response regulator